MASSAGSGISLVGTHRGGRDIVKNLDGTIATGLLWSIVDPKPGRAAELGELFRRRHGSVTIRPFAASAEDYMATDSFREANAIVAATDTVTAQQALLDRAESRHVLWQMVGSASDSMSPPMGVRGTVLASDAESRARQSEFLRALTALTKGQSASSSVLTSDPLAGLSIVPQRNRISEATAHHIGQLDRDPGDLSHGGALAVTFGSSLMPLMTASFKGGNRFREKREAAFEIVNTQLLTGSAPETFTVGLLDDRGIDFMTVRRSRHGALHLDGIREWRRPEKIALPSNAGSSPMELDAASAAALAFLFTD